MPNQMRPNKSRFRATVSTCLNYCNTFIAGVHACKVKFLQLVPKAVVCLLFGNPKRTLVTPLLNELHWLSIASYIKFKSLTTVYRMTVWSGSKQSKLMHTGLYSLSLSWQEHYLVLPTLSSKQSQSKQTDLICGSNVAEWNATCYQSRGIPL